MRTILAIFAATILLVGCKDGKGRILDPNAKISIRPATMPQGSATATATATASASKAPIYPTPLEVVQKTTDIVMKNKLYPNEPYINFGISDEQRDVAVPKLMMWGMWVVENGKLSPTFIEAAYDVVLVTRENMQMHKPITDTLAYIPNAQLRAAEVAIKAAFAAENYDLVYQLFDEAYKFTPINGADWRALQEK